MTEPDVAVAREHADAVGVQRVVGVRDLGERRVDIWQRQDREQAKPLRVIAHERGAVVVAGAGEPAGLRRVAKPDPGLVIDTIAAATPPRSMSSIDCSGVQRVLAGCSSGRPLTSATHAGGAK